VVVSKKIYTGKVVSDRMDKTVVVAVISFFQHPVYKKTLKRVAKFKAHDEANKYHIGDTVKIIETRPLSKDKRWVVID
jgi:small subunit ribosomal protein S17